MAGGMCTFAYPYMNGRLHIGHAMTIINTDVATRWLKQQGEDVIFPFGFHCTGMPIYASAKKLEHGDQAVHDSLINMGISDADVSRFKDPKHWVRIFPELAINDLRRFGLICDYDRSFVTTSVNPYYNSFIQWQYRQLYSQGRLKYSDRPCIYSELDQQPCADHDRQIGEGVKPVPYKLYNFSDGFKIIQETYDSHVASSAPPSPMDAPPSPALYASPNDIAIVLETPNGVFRGSVPQYWYTNMKHQGLNVNKCEPTPPQVPNTLEHPRFVDTGVKIWFPESTVTSRTGDRCIVATVPQWYISYSEPEWKCQVQKVLSNMTIHDPELRKQLEIAIENMDDWCVSREYGLGTRIPWDERYLIDSLSDSTIYMAYYTICHLLHRDLYGDDQIIPVDQIDDQFWDTVFLGKIYNGTIDSSTVMAARAQFQQYYPPRLRVSGKDLIYNHLVMSIYHHVAIFGEDMCCLEYQVNGYAKLNGKKMSKSTGNFITLSDALDKYRVDALRVMLIESGDGLEDSNIRLKDYANTCLAIDKYLASKQDKMLPCMPPDTSKLHYDMLIYCHQKAQKAFSEGKFREAITFGWRKCAKIISSKLAEEQPWLQLLAQKIQDYTMTPILGQDDDSDGDIFFVWLSGCEPVPEQTNKYYEMVQAVHSAINKKMAASAGAKCLNVEIHEKLKAHENDLKEHIKSAHGIDVTITYDQSVLHPKRDPYRLKPKISVVCAQ